MKLTRITAENKAYFAGLCPEELLSDKKTVKLGVLSEKDEPVSICIADIRDEKLCIRWIYTDEDMRDQGGATFLLTEMLRLVEGMDLEGVEVDFLSDDRDLKEFFMENGFLVGEDENLYRVPMMDMLYSARMDAILAHRSFKPTICRLDELKDMKAFADSFRANDIDTVFLEDISKRYSFVSLDSEGAMTEGIFISETGEGDLHINYLAGNGSTQGIVDLVAALYDALMEDAKTEGDLIFYDRQEAGVSIVEMLAGNDGETYRVEGPMYAVKLL